MPSCFLQGRVDRTFLRSSFAEKHVTSFQERFPFQALKVEMKFLVSHAGLGNHCPPVGVLNQVTAGSFQHSNKVRNKQ